MFHQRRNKYIISLLILIPIFIIFSTPVLSENWSGFEIMKLPDSSFAVVETGEDGTKIKHCPHHDLNGKLDNEQLIYVLGTFEQETWHKEKNKKEAKRHLNEHYQKFLRGVLKQSSELSVNINKAMLSELVLLPAIGPVIAVKIVGYREQHGKYEKVEDIKKVQGIGPSIFKAIRHYISID